MRPHENSADRTTRRVADLAPSHEATSGIAPRERGSIGFTALTDWLAARGESRASPREWRWSRRTRRDEGEYRQYSTDEQRSSAVCSAARMQRDFHHGLLGAASGVQSTLQSAGRCGLSQ